MNSSGQQGEGEEGSVKVFLVTKDFSLGVGRARPPSERNETLVAVCFSVSFFSFFLFCY